MYKYNYLNLPSGYTSPLQPVEYVQWKKINVKQPIETACTCYKFFIRKKMRKTVIYTQSHAHPHTHTRVRAHTNMHTHAHTCSHTDRDAHIHTETQMHTHTQTYTHIHTHAYTTA